MMRGSDMTLYVFHAPPPNVANDAICSRAINELQRLTLIEAL